MQLIALTGFGTVADRQRSQDAGFDQHVVKPAQADELTRLLSSA
jgi:two-component system, chemotaxis family, CheB/CheR fusion protein